MVATHSSQGLGSAAPGGVRFLMFMWVLPWGRGRCAWRSLGPSLGDLVSYWVLPPFLLTSYGDRAGGCVF